MMALSSTATSSVPLKRRPPLQLDVPAHSQRQPESLSLQRDEQGKASSFSITCNDHHGGTCKFEIPFKGNNGFAHTQFELGNHLGQGEGGSVMLATHRDTKHNYALKEIDAHTQGSRQQLCQELQAHRQCGRTDHIVFLHDYYAHEGRVYLVLEYMDWGSLDELLKRQRISGKPKMDECVLSIVLGSILQGLSFLQRANLVHRDMKPGNVVLNRSGVVKLSDFGISRVLQQEERGSTFVGSAMYMSPERLEGKEYTHKADIWSVGIMAVECALGLHPYQRADAPAESSFFDLLQRVVYEPAPIPTTAGLSDELVSLIQLCLIKEDINRPSAQDLLSHPFIVMHAAQGFDVVGRWLSTVSPQGDVLHTE